MTPEREPSNRPASKAQPRYRGKAFTSSKGQASYRRIDPLAVTSLVLGLLAFLPMFGWVMIPIPIAGVVFGIVALRRIDRSFGEKKGIGISLAGLVLSTVLGLLGIAIFNFVIVHGAPIGYTSVTFPEMQPDKETGEVIPPDILELDGKFIYVKGYMYPGRRSMGIQQFILVPTQYHCKFCQRDLASTEMIKVIMTGDELADFKSHLVGVGGKLEIDHEEALRPLGGMPYTIKADVFRD